MYRPIQLSTANLSVLSLTSRSPLPRGYPAVLLALALALFALSPTIRAVTPAPDGGYPNADTAEGDFALQSVTSGSNTTAIGFNALKKDTTGDDNTATGAAALELNSTGSFNTASGALALESNSTGNNNTAAGAFALEFNSTGDSNTANGVSALLGNTTGFQNTASGATALASNRTGGLNTASGNGALQSNTTASNNTASGAFALFSNTTGSVNTATGRDALGNNTIGGNNIALGFAAGVNLTTGSNNIDIGAPGVAAEANAIRIGKSGTQKKTFIAGIRGVTVASGVGVIVGTSGQLGTVVSSARFKEAIKPMDKASEALLKLKPVTFHYKEKFDPDSIPQFGLVAEQVEKVNPDLVVRDEDGKVSAVRYEAVNAMLLNEFLKEHWEVKEQQSTIAELKATIAEQQKQIATQQATAAQQQKQIEALTSTVQKVSDQVALSKPAPQLVANP
jgi:hypothetical protein